MSKFVQMSLISALKLLALVGLPLYVVSTTLYYYCTTWQIFHLHLVICGVVGWDVPSLLRRPHLTVEKCQAEQGQDWIVGEWVGRRVILFLYKEVGGGST